MKMITRFILTLLLAVAIQPMYSKADSGEDIRLLLDQAEAQVWLGISNKGDGMTLHKGLEHTHMAAAMLDNADLSPEQSERLRQEISETEEQLRVIIALYDERFYGSYPLARLLSPKLLKGDGLAVTEQLFHPPEEAAVELAGRNFSAKVRNIDTPHVVIHSSPRDPLLENVAFEVLARVGATVPVNRRGLRSILGPDQLEKFDRGDMDLPTVAAMMSALNIESLIVMAISPTAASGQELFKIKMAGDLYRHGRSLNGNSSRADPAVRVARIVSYGTVVDSRHLLLPITLIQLFLFAAAVFIASSVHWKSGRLKLVHKMAIGTALFIFGRFFATVLVIGLARVAPDPSDMARASVWWPAALGVAAVLLGGLLAWIGQAYISDIVPGTRGARAVGTIFGLTALGSASYFVRPVLLLESTAGYSVLLPFLLASTGLAILFGYAIRTGPPVPTWFAIGPLILAAWLGILLLKSSPVQLWLVALLTGILYALASWRHRYAVAHGIEELEPSTEDAALADEERLRKLRSRLKKK